MSVSLRSVPGTQAAMGWADGHTLVIDRAEGKAGGMGLGFNGGQMIALAIGGCFCNDLRYMAEERGLSIATIAVEVTVTLEGAPLLVTAAEMTASVTFEDASVDVTDFVRRTEAISAVTNSVRAGFPVTVRAARGGTGIRQTR
jgi:organic hydroperoxide reductase OsmC/OhrA